jgi:hypothetical protein
MRFVTAILSVLVAAASASAAAVAVERRLSGIYKCSCPIDTYGNAGTNLIEDGTALTYTCAYTHGSCEWSQVSFCRVRLQQLASFLTHDMRR